ncbi:DUF6402 family protein [Noviherbaspirillum aerium]|uniref:DUF6402 family protein n=1 Tax=Noviherbaspirillum aerium TaxID=2588497 RepID=UPI00124CB786|nr:DUF6402 family protein [Noviherbaspirillum aerium]
MSISEALRGTYANVMRVVSTEAATLAQSNEACFKDFQLVEIPDVMSRMNAAVGAALMKRWFNSPPFVLPPSWKSGTVDFRAVSRKNIDTAILKMSWLAGFARAAQAMSLLELQRTQTPAAERELKRVLMRSGLLTGARRAIGNTNDVVALHETAHLNMISVGFSNSTDALDCALGSFTLHMAVSGFVQPLPKRGDGCSHQVEVHALHFYVRDNYDFTADDEPLGHWGREGASTLYSTGKVFVENRSFREWRRQHARGGDFVVFSDILTKSLAKPLIMRI